jgi:hypothetical protein
METLTLKRVYPVFCWQDGRKVQHWQRDCEQLAARQHQGTTQPSRICGARVMITRLRKLDALFRTARR